MVSCFFPFDNGEFLEDIKRFYDSFSFAVYKEWMGINIMPISSARIPNTTTNKFNIHLSNGFPGLRTSSLGLL